MFPFAEHLKNPKNAIAASASPVRRIRVGRRGTGGRNGGIAVDADRPA
jgi:hypothetical protein